MDARPAGDLTLSLPGSDGPFADGHVFVMRGDLARLACDAVLVPTDSQLNITRGWQPFFDGLELRPFGDWSQVPLDAPAGWGDTIRAFDTKLEHDGRAVWLLETGTVDPTPEWVAGAVAQGVEAAAAVRTRGDRREKHLLGLPLVGTGAGGLQHRRGALIEHLLPQLNDIARHHDVDIALVLADDRDMAAVTASRPEDSWSSLSPELLAEADRLGGLAARGGLALFLGAGVSVPLGLPDWSTFMAALASKAGTSISGNHEQDAQAVADVLTPDELHEIVRRTFNVTRHSLAHGLLASLDASQIVTTNYDNAYEIAAAGRDTQQQLRVLVRQVPRAGAPWLLKIHGDASAPATIVLTREQYIELGHSGAPLRGMVQSLLMTSHLLFVGYSMVDRTFLLLSRELRDVLAKSEGGSDHVATALSIRSDDGFAEHAPAEVDVVSMPANADEAAAGARLLEIFLDRVLWQAGLQRDDSVQHLLDDRYAEMISDEADSKLKTAIEEFVGSMPEKARSSTGWPPVRDMLRRLGADPR